MARRCCAWPSGLARYASRTQRRPRSACSSTRRGPGGPDIVVRIYGPARTGSRWSPRSLRHLRGEPLAEGSAPYAQTPELTLIDAAGSAVARTTRGGRPRVRTEILTESLPLRTLLAGFACSMVMPEWVDRPAPAPSRADS